MDKVFRSRLTRRGMIAGSIALSVAGKAAMAQTPNASPAASPAQAAAPAPKYNGEQAKITYGIWDDTQKNGVTKQIEAFKKAQPNIEVEIQVVPWADYWTKLQTSVGGGEAWDVFWLNSANCPVYAKAGALVPLTSLFEDGSLDKANYPEAVFNLYEWEGNHYATPREYDTIGLFYNKKMFDDAGEKYPDDSWDWAKLTEVAKKFTDEGKGTWGIGLQPNSGQENWYNWVFQNDGKLLNDDRSACVVADDTNSADGIKENIQMFLDKLTPDLDVQQNNKVEETLFPGGQVAMLPGGSFRAATYAANEGVKIGVAPLPKGKKQACVTHGLGNAVWSGSKNAGAAVEFAKWLATEEAEKILGESGMGIPAFKGLESTWLSSFTDKEFDAKVFTDAAEYAVNVPDTDAGPEWQGKMGDEIKKGYTGETSKDDAPKVMQDAANAVITGA